MPDTRLGSFDFLQLRLKRLVELLALTIEFQLSALTIRIGCGNRLLQAFALGGNLRSNFREQPQAIRFQLLATFDDVVLFGTQLLDDRLLRSDLLGERHFALPQHFRFGLQLLIGRLFPRLQFATILLELLKLCGENLIATLQFGNLSSQLINEESSLGEYLVVPLWNRAATLV